MRIACWLPCPLFCSPLFASQRDVADDAVKERSKSTRPLLIRSFQCAALPEALYKGVLNGVVDVIQQH